MMTTAGREALPPHVLTDFNCDDVEVRCNSMLSPDSKNAPPQAPSPPPPPPLSPVRQKMELFETMFKRQGSKHGEASRSEKETMSTGSGGRQYGELIKSRHKWIEEEHMRKRKKEGGAIKDKHVGCYRIAAFHGVETRDTEDEGSQFLQQREQMQSINVLATPRATSPTSTSPRPGTTSAVGSEQRDAAPPTELHECSSRMSKTSTTLIQEDRVEIVAAKSATSPVQEIVGFFEKVAGKADGQQKLPSAPTLSNRSNKSKKSQITNNAKPPKPPAPPQKELTEAEGQKPGMEDKSTKAPCPETPSRKFLGALRLTLSRSSVGGASRKSSKKGSVKTAEKAPPQPPKQTASSNYQFEDLTKNDSSLFHVDSIPMSEISFSEPEGNDGGEDNTNNVSILDTDSQGDDTSIKVALVNMISKYEQKVKDEAEASAAATAGEGSRSGGKLECIPSQNDQSRKSRDDIDIPKNKTESSLFDRSSSASTSNKETEGGPAEQDASSVNPMIVVQQVQSDIHPLVIPINNNDQDQDDTIIDTSAAPATKTTPSPSAAITTRASNVRLATSTSNGDDEWKVVRVDSNRIGECEKACETRCLDSGCSIM